MIDTMVRAVQAVTRDDVFTMNGRRYRVTGEPVVDDEGVVSVPVFPDDEIRFVVGTLLEIETE